MRERDDLKIVRIARQKLKLIVYNCDYAIELELGVAIRQTIELELGVAICQKRVGCGYIYKHLCYVGA